MIGFIVFLLENNGFSKIKVEPFVRLFYGVDSIVFYMVPGHDRIL